MKQQFNEKTSNSRIGLVHKMISELFSLITNGNTNLLLPTTELNTSVIDYIITNRQIFPTKCWPSIFTRRSFQFTFLNISSDARVNNFGEIVPSCLIPLSYLSCFHVFGYIYLHEYFVAYLFYVILIFWMNTCIFRSLANKTHNSMESNVLL